MELTDGLGQSPQVLARETKEVAEPKLWRNVDKQGEANADLIRAASVFSSSLLLLPQAVFIK